MNELREHIIRRDQEAGVRVVQIDEDIKNIGNDANARHVTLEARIANLEENMRTSPQHAAGDESALRSRSVVVFGMWPMDTERSRIVEDIIPY